MIGIKQIAEEAGVSKTTVSFVLNGRHKHGLRISEPVAARVLATAKRLGYVRNELVQAVVKGRSHVIAIVAHFSEICMPIVMGYSDEAAAHGYSIRLISMNGDLDAALMKAIAARVDAVVALGIPVESRTPAMEKFIRYGIPIFGLEAETHLCFFDQTHAARLASEHLALLGHRKIYCCHEDSEVQDLRLEGYRAAMREHGLEENIIHTANLDVDELLATGADAVFCSADHIALKIMHDLYLRRMFVPETLSVVGFGNTAAGKQASPALTTVNEPYYETGILSCRFLLYRLETGKELELQPLSSELIVRESTAVNTKYNRHEAGEKKPK